ncbi:MAG: ParA family protein [Thermoguttaceae bacterium]
MPERLVTDCLERVNARDMKVIKIANQKGGTAKTTSTAAMGVILSRRGYRVHLIDFGRPRDHSPAWPGYPLLGCTPAEPNSVSPGRGQSTSHYRR